MRKTDSNDIRLALEAADWFERLENDEIDEKQRRNVIRWLNQSPDHLEAVRFMHRLCDSLRTRRRMH